MASNNTLLAVDVGNTKMMVGLFTGDELEHSWRLATRTHRSADEVRLALYYLLQMDKVDPADIHGAILASVVPDMTELFIEALARLIDGRTLVLDHTTSIGLTNRYEHPEEVGADRLANAVGGKLLFGLPLIVVDFGTAITLDVISEKAEYLGGIIMPGPEMAAESLHRRAAKLPRITLEKPPRLIGATSEMSIRSGLFHGMLGAVDAMIEGIREDIGADCKAVGTGGFGELMVRESKHIEEYEPNITLIGLREIWRLNNERNRAK